MKPIDIYTVDRYAHEVTGKFCTQLVKLPFDIFEGVSIIGLYPHSII